MKLTDSTQLCLINDLNLFAVLLAYSLSVILYSESVLLCAMPFLVNIVCAPKQRGGTEAFGNGMLHPAN